MAASGIDSSIKRFVKQESPEPLKPIEIPKYSSESETAIKPEFSPTFTLVTSPWGSGMQLVQFRATAEQVADDYLSRTISNYAAVESGHQSFEIYVLIGAVNRTVRKLKFVDKRWPEVTLV